MNITSNYIKAANALKGVKRQRIVAYVESYDDVLFWRTVLGEFENDERYFEVMLPTRRTLTKGKKQVIMQLMQHGGGGNMIACVDADYDYLMQGATNESKMMLNNPYVFHTYAYAIENMQCYAPSLHNVCVMATLNDHAIFDFKTFMKRLSEIIFPLFVWSIWFYKRREFKKFSITDFNHCIEMGHFSPNNPDKALERMRHRVEVKLRDLERNFPQHTTQVENLAGELASLGVTPTTTYLFMQGHHLFDNIVSKVVYEVCKRLRSERETEIRDKALHSTQRQNELSAYRHVQDDTVQMLKKNMGFTQSKLFERIRQDLTEQFGEPNN